MHLLRDLTLGHYYPADSFVHRLDPRVKLMGLLLAAVTLFGTTELWGLALFFLAALWLTRLARLPVTLVIRGLRPFGWLFLLTAGLQLFFTPGPPLPPFDLGPLKISQLGLYQATRIGGQLFLVILFSSLLTLTTSPLELLRALEKLGLPLKRLRVPVSDICLAMLLCIRFLPTLSREAERILEAQRMRGADPAVGNWRLRLQKFHGFFLTLLYNVFGRAEELATAMVARGYGQEVEKQTLKQMRLSRADRLSLAVVTLWCIILLCLCHV